MGAEKRTAESLDFVRAQEFPIIREHPLVHEASSLGEVFDAIDGGAKAAWYTPCSSSWLMLAEISPTERRKVFNAMHLFQCWKMEKASPEAYNFRASTLWRQGYPDIVETFFEEFTATEEAFNARYPDFLALLDGPVVNVGNTEPGVRHCDFDDKDGKFLGLVGVAWGESTELFPEMKSASDEPGGLLKLPHATTLVMRLGKGGMYHRIPAGQRVGLAKGHDQKKPVA